jgi:hypothetical protein
MSIKEAVFSGFYRRKRAQDQNLRIGLKKRLERVINGVIFGHFNSLVCQFNAIDKYIPIWYDYNRLPP